MKIKQYTIAIIDDDEDDRELLAGSFRENYENLAILTFDSGAGFLSFLISSGIIPDLVVTDYYMPLLSGLEVIGSMRTNPLTLLVPVVLLSTIKSEPVVKEMADMEAAHYFIKPINLNEYDLLTKRIMSIID